MGMHAGYVQQTAVFRLAVSPARPAGSPLEVPTFIGWTVFRMVIENAGFAMRYDYLICFI